MYNPPSAARPRRCRPLSSRRGIVLILLVLLAAAVCAAPSVPLRPGETGEKDGEPAGTVEAQIRSFAERLQKATLTRHGHLRQKPDLHALARLKLVKARLLRRNYWAGSYRDEQIRTHLESGRAILDAILEGEEPPLEKHGRLERAYLADNDGSAQPYQLYVPESYDGAEPFGLLVYLHGYSPDLNRENWVRYMYADVLDSYAEQTRSIMVMPFARSNTDFQGCGEDDVMRAIREVRADYRIEPDRVVLSGYSMGGMGVWTIGAHYPHEFAALLPMSSRADFYLWKGIEPAEIPGFKRKLAEQEFGANLLGNYRHLPIFMMHGNEDYGIPVRQSRRMHERLEEAGMDARYVELEGQGHLFFYREQQTRPELVEWIRSRRRVRNPRRISYRTYSLQYARGYWARIEGIGNWGRAAEVTCEISEDGESLRVESENVLSLRLEPPETLVAEPGGLEVTWNGEAVDPRIDGRVLKLGPLTNPHSESEDVPDLVKKPGLCGPVREAFSGPFVMVYGKSAPDETNASPGVGEGETPTSKDLATGAAVDWLRFAKGRPRLLPAQKVDRTIIENNNLFLFGPPAQNPLMRRVLEDLPVRITENHIEIRGRRYAADRHGLWMIYPNPLNPDRYVVINTGLPWGKGLPVNHKYDMIPDFIVYTGEKTRDDTECNKYVAAGFFDQFWQFDEESTWFSEQPK